MVPIPKDVVDPIAAAIYSHYEQVAEDWRRDHLGASMIGGPCNRSLWYSFRWALAPGQEPARDQFDRWGRMLRLFERGDDEEEKIVRALRGVGVHVVDKDEKGEQYRFASIGGHFGGGCDGFLLGLETAPKTWHLLEIKTANKRRFEALLRKGVKEAMPKHYAQMQSYMRGFGLKRALYVCVCKDDDRIYTERVKVDVEHGDKMLRRAEHVVGAAEPLSKISNDPSHFECKFCDHKAICHGARYELVERNCRTCASSTPEPDGSWSCGLWKISLTSEQQRDGCGEHLMNPAFLVPWKPVDVSPVPPRFVTYGREEDEARFTDSGGQFVSAVPSRAPGVPPT